MLGIGCWVLDVGRSFHSVIITPMSKKQKPKEQSDTLRLAIAIEHLSKKRVVNVYESKFKFFWYNIYRGMLTGFGSVIGATVLIALVLHFSQYFINWPVIGDFLKNIFKLLEEYNGAKSSGTYTPYPTP